MLKIFNLKASIEGKEILKGIDFEVGAGELHVLMGPNGSGKTSMEFVLMVNPKYFVEQGEISFDGTDIKNLTADK